MRKSLLTLSLALMLGTGAAVAVAATQTETAAAQNPVLLAQASPQPFTRPLPPREGRARVPLSPEQLAERRQAICDDRADRMAGQLAYLEARLDLNDAQRVLFARWRDARLSAAERQSRACAARPGRGATPLSPVEQMARQEEMLRQRLADLSVQRAALEALYNSLSAEQREKFQPVGARRDMGRRGMRPRMAMMLRDRLIQRGEMRRGPAGRGGPGMMPPPGAPVTPPTQ